MLNTTELSRLQFALTAMYHFLFVPLTLGLSFLIAVMETIFVISRHEVYRRMVKFWGKLFTINFALGVATGLAMEFQFGTNWSYFSHYVGDVFGVPLAMEGLVAFFLESTFIGLFIFGWKHLSEVQHLIVTWLVAIGSNLSALWILIANGWMQNPVSSRFNHLTMRMEVDSFRELFMNPVAQVKFVHTVAAGYCTGVMFVLGISSYYLLRKRNVEFARKSFTIAASFGILSILSTIILGDESGYQMNRYQKSKLASVEALWVTEEAPTSFSLFCVPDQDIQENHLSVKIPHLLGVLATRSFDTPVIGLKDIMLDNERRILRGIRAYKLLEALKNNPTDPSLTEEFQAMREDLGYGLLFKQHFPDLENFEYQQVNQVVLSSIPMVLPLYFSFRIMLLCGVAMFSLILTCFRAVLRKQVEKSWKVHRAMIFAIPLPWIASESGWFVSEYGRQPWIISEILPTSAAASNLGRGSLIFSLGLICTMYTVFLMVELFLMVRLIRLGPEMLTECQQTTSSRLQSDSPQLGGGS